MSLVEYYRFRHDLVEYLAGDLVGPSAPEEEIEGAPINRYIMGVLYPRKSGHLDPALDNAPAEDDTETGFADPPVSFANVQYPSSIGMTFAVDTHAATEIVVRIRGARYVPLTEEVDEEVLPADANVKRAGPTERWKRCPLPEIIQSLPVASATTMRCFLTEELTLYLRVRPADAEGRAAVTVVLMNTLTAGNTPGDRDRKCIFQPEVHVTAATSSGTDTGIFVERPTPGLVGNDEDLRSYRLLYRHACEFATGHGCAVAWDLIPGTSDRVSTIRTTFTPTVRVALSDSRELISRATGMRYLATASRDEILSELSTFCAGYGDWITDRRSDMDNLTGDFHVIADSHMTQCDDALRRMRAGIAVLAADDNVWRAFTLMNRVLLQQRARSVWIGTGKPTDAPVESDEHRWRPFQLGFILLCIEGIARPDSADRSIADLLWFPTGGGKTEAYLGLIALTVFLRRLRNAEGGGVTALMRYTLRLLTIQQFERAALLICCCEALRQEEHGLGTEPISIGLWVGQGATPNKLADAKTALNRLRDRLTPEKGDPVQLHSCPWCGSPMDHTHYKIPTGSLRVVIACKTPGCRYATGLPVFVTDEEVYRFRPTLIIATVDKFAALPWRETTADLFNRANAGRPSQIPPELIIQDELHLISGPLGTLVGLYETAVDLLCSRDGIGPKLIASTATIRRAAAQIHALFDRPVHQFPPAGLDARDSYFAVEAGPEAKGDRAYVGLMAPGTSPATLLVRAYAALLQGVAVLPGDDAIKDPYWTLVGYFNSLRVLGGAVMQVRDDVGDRITLLAANDRAHLADGADIEERTIEYQIELTSREPSGKIPGYLKHMAVRRPNENTLDVILATNMISVGVDVDRLGLMVVMGQPQTTSEYIQASSRVGRRFPGLVVVLLHAARSRDRSHYESFAAYHGALYRQVEATGVTPFSARARDRGLHAVFVALARMIVPGLRPNDGADELPIHLDEIAYVKAKILDRVRKVAPDEVDATARQIDDIIARWRIRAESVPDLEYDCFKDRIRTLLIDAALGTENPEALPTLWSLRDVDAESRLRLID